MVEKQRPSGWLAMVDGNINARTSSPIYISMSSIVEITTQHHCNLPTPEMRT
jgi:hypothetical protein